MVNERCGSSREHAPWALLDFGIRCVIAPSFADIFHSNCFKNGILPVVLPEEEVCFITDALNTSFASLTGFLSCLTQVNRLSLWAEEGGLVTVDLENNTVRAETPDGQIVGEEVSFEVDPFRRECLLNGW